MPADKFIRLELQYGPPEEARTEALKEAVASKPRMPRAERAAGAPGRPVQPARPRGKPRKPEPSKRGSGCYSQLARAVGERSSKRRSNREVRGRHGGRQKVG